MAKVRVTKVFRFEMAHALDGYEGLCKNIHGHSYVFSVTVLGEPMQEEGNPENGLVVDFGDLKKIVNENVVNHFDHALILKETSPFLKSLDKTLNERLITTPYQPSCENLLLHFIEIIRPLFPNNLQLVSARLNETQNSYAEWLLSDQN